MKCKLLPITCVLLAIILVLPLCSITGITTKDLLNRNKCPKRCTDARNSKLRIECYSRAINKNSYNPSLYFQRGNAYQDMLKFTSAMSDDLKVIELEPGNTKAYYALARVASIAFYKEFAILWLEKAIEAGFNDYQMIVEDPFFKNIRHTERFKELLKDKVISTVSYKK